MIEYSPNDRSDFLYLSLHWRKKTLQYLKKQSNAETNSLGYFKKPINVIVFIVFFEGVARSNPTMLEVGKCYSSESIGFRVI
jgi:hypothetical protein